MLFLDEKFYCSCRTINFWEFNFLEKVFESATKNIDFLYWTIQIYRQTRLCCSKQNKDIIFHPQCLRNFDETPIKHNTSYLWIQTSTIANYISNLLEVCFLHKTLPYYTEVFGVRHTYLFFLATSEAHPKENQSNTDRNCSNSYSFHVSVYLNRCSF